MVARICPLGYRWLQRPWSVVDGKQVEKKVTAVYMTWLPVTWQAMHALTDSLTGTRRSRSLADAFSQRFLTLPSRLSLPRSAAARGHRKA